jgi:hypothetical protein
VTVKVTAVMLAGSIASLKVAAKLLLNATPLAPLAGLVELTVGTVGFGKSTMLSPQAATVAARRSANRLVKREKRVRAMELSLVQV